MGKESACNAGGTGSAPGFGRSPGEGKGYPLQYSGLENSMDCIVHGATKSRTRLSNFHFQDLKSTYGSTTKILGGPIPCDVYPTSAFTARPSPLALATLLPTSPRQKESYQVISLPHPSHRCFALSKPLHQLLSVNYSNVNRTCTQDEADSGCNLVKYLKIVTCQ